MVRSGIFGTKTTAGNKHALLGMLKMDGLKSKFAFLRASARLTKQAMCVYILSLNQLERSLAVPEFSPDP